jgi:hypothetical protein
MIWSFESFDYLGGVGGSAPHIGPRERTRDRGTTDIVRGRRLITAPAAGGVT